MSLTNDALNEIVKDPLRVEDIQVVHVLCQAIENLGTRIEHLDSQFVALRPAIDMIIRRLKQLEDVQCDS
jgi:hypothetical protein